MCCCYSTVDLPVHERKQLGIIIHGSYMNLIVIPNTDDEEKEYIGLERDRRE